MAQNILFNGVAYEIPDTGDTDWGENLTDYFVAIPQGALQKVGGSFVLTADVNFGSNYGPVAIYVKSVGNNISTAGFIRMERTAGIGWRNAGNSANLLLEVNGSNELTFNGVKLTVSGEIRNADIAADAAIDRTKLASGTAYRLLANNASGVMSENAALTANHVPYIDANGQLASEATLAKSRGGSGQDNSSLTFPASGTLATLAGAEELTNKTFGDAQTLTQVATPSNPASGKNKFYVKSDGNLYVLNSSGIEQQVGSGAGGGLKNYLGTVNNVNGNGNFELGSATKWSLFNTTLTGVIPTGSISAGAASITTFDVTNSNPLAGTYSLSVASSGAITAGHGFISDAFTIDNEDKAKVLAQKFCYSIVSGDSNLDMSGTSTNTWAMYLYDVTNSEWIQPAGVYDLIQKSGSGICTGTMQTSSNGTQYRLAIICVNASAGASSMLFDDFFCGPQVTAAGAAVSDMTAFTPTLTNLGNATAAGYWKRVGDELVGRIVVTIGASLPSASGFYLTIVPSGLTIDTNKTPLNSTVGTAVSYVSAQSHVGGIVLASTTSGYPNGDDGTGQWVDTVPITWAAGDIFTANYRVPISGWSSNTVMSNDTDTRVVAASGQNGAGQSIPNAAETVLELPSILFDSHSCMSTNGTYTVPVSGYYRCSFQAMLNGAGGGGYRYGGIYKNGVTYINSNDVASAGTDYITLTASGIIQANAGDTIQAFVYQSSGGAVALINTATFNHVDIERISGPATIAASETVVARYNIAAAQSIPDATTTILNFDTKEKDSHSAVTTGASWKFTAPISGEYRLDTFIQFAASATGQRNLAVHKNGSQIKNLQAFYTLPATEQSSNGSTTITLTAGDYIDLRVYQNSGGALNVGAANPVGEYNTVCITKVGN